MKSRNGHNRRSVAVGAPLCPWTFAASVLATLLIAGACTATTTDRLKLNPLRTVDRVDLGRYTGTWYEIASFPQSFQKGCTGTTATYSLQKSGEIEVFNRCNLDVLDGAEKSATGWARVVDTNSNARLKVSFFRPFWGDYWIIDLGPNYEFAVVGHPGRDYLWVLSRTPKMSDSVYAGILERLREQQYQVERLRRTLQAG